MGGDPVLDFNRRVGLFVRDGKTQKNFSDVLRDHPEGLPSAIKNSRAMQNQIAASAGYIPNFAPIVRKVASGRSCGRGKQRKQKMPIQENPEKEQRKK